jgi:hypothetical protein
MTAPKNAEFRIKNSSKRIKTHFNPATLEITITTQLGPTKDKKKGGGQVVNEGTSKLSVQLIYDTTDTMTNVCDQTVEIARLLGEQGKPPPQVTFDWGAFQFTGIVDSYKETLDFFSDQGVPLRSTVAITMKKDEDLYSRGAAGENTQKKNAGRWSGGPGGGDGAAQVNAPSAGGSATTTATQAGAPGAGRAIAAQNGEESMRFLRSPTLTIDASVKLAPPVAFTSPGVSLGASASLGASGGLGASASLGASVSLGGSVGAGLSTASIGGGSAGVSLSFGGSASAGVPLSQGAFAGLRVSAPAASANLSLDPRRLVQRAETYTYAADDDAAFELGGRMKTQGARLGGSARARIRFEEE